MVQQIYRVPGFSVFVYPGAPDLLGFVLCLARSGTEIHTSIHEAYVRIMEQKTIWALGFRATIELGHVKAGHIYIYIYIMK